MNIYTKTGDKGQTGLVTGERVLKSDLRIEAYGGVDELNAVIGMLLDTIGIHPTSGVENLCNELRGVQNHLFSLGTELASAAGQVPAFATPYLLTEQDVSELETSIDQMTTEIPPLRNFVLPGGHPTGSCAHLARTVCRRAERAAVRLAQVDGVRDTAIKYLNRLSDWLFTVSRFLVMRYGVQEVLWIPRQKR